MPRVGSRRSTFSYLLLGSLALVVLILSQYAVMHHRGVDRSAVKKKDTTTSSSGGAGKTKKKHHTDKHKGPKESSSSTTTSTTTTTTEAPAAPQSTLIGEKKNAKDLQNGPPRSKAYLLIISNEEFLDGALVLGVSLRKHSDMLQRGEADMAIIITEGRVGPTSQQRLRHEGGFDQIIEVPSLAKRAPKAYWKDTFDKIYMFNLTQYETIVFMDADMICVRSMDELFEKKSDRNVNSVSAIGFRGGSEGPYFQTGMMVLVPSRVKFGEIFEKFESGVPPRGNLYNHGMNGRDGVLLRDVFQNNFKILDNKYSRNLNPRWKIPNSVISLHLRGKVKPWFDRSLPNAEPELGKKEFGFPYVLWWEIYESDIHYKSLEYAAAVAGKEVVGYGGSKAAAGVSPLTHAWMMRYTTKEYVQLLGDESARRRNLTLPGLQYRTGKANQSCVEVCEGAEGSLQCSAEAFLFSHGQRCDVLQEAFPKCVSCEPGVYWRPHPGSDYPAMDFFKGKWVCKYNLMLDERGRPNCTAKYETSQRFCPCVPRSNG